MSMLGEIAFKQMKAQIEKMIEKNTGEKDIKILSAEVFLNCEKKITISKIKATCNNGKTYPINL